MPSSTRVAIVAAASFSLVGAVSITSILAETARAQTYQAISGIPASIRGVMPAGYLEVARRPVKLDGRPEQLVRFERADGRNSRLGGEHFSIIVDSNDRLNGFVRMDLALVGDTFPTNEDAKAAAVQFLREAAPDLLPSARITGTELYREPLQVHRNGRSETLELSGIRVKMYNAADGSWMWVVVGANRQLMLFERNLLWEWYRGGRTTEKWLYDSWIAENGYVVRPLG